ncbi:MAG: hypothetical protein OXG72_03710, partial [Acidobacteria bacterium]|nr:hypothetical protein [Acidobacteriota bacterium]
MKSERQRYTIGKIGRDGSNALLSENWFEPIRVLQSRRRDDAVEERCAMTSRFLPFLLVGVWLMAIVVAAAAQSSGDDWTVPRTADGHPDLQGVWASDSATPLERPEELADTPFLTDEEVATLAERAAELFNGETDAAFGESVFRAALADRTDYQSGDGVTEENPQGTGNYNQFWLIDRWFDNRTALIEDPP